MNALEQHIGRLQESLSTFHFPKTPEKLYDPLRYFMTLGGKRIRPVLTTLSAEMLGVDIDEAIPAALTIEFFHNFSLIHDDIMDEAPDRRGNPTVHTKWNRDVAILSGDVLFVEAYNQLCAYSDDRLHPLLNRFNQTAREVCEGQQMDMDFESMDRVSIPEYIEMIRLKTSVLLGCSLEFGAILARANQEVRDSLYQFGVQMGIGFQIQDDLLDLYADPEKFGKQVGGDIIANKKTMLFLQAAQLAGINAPEKWDELMAITDANQKISFAQHLFKEIGAVEATKNSMNAYYNEAIDCLEKVRLLGYNTHTLKQVAENLMVREL